MEKLLFQKQFHKNNSLEIYRNNIIINGILGQIIYKLGGQDILIRNNSLILKSKVSYKLILGIILRDLENVNEGLHIELGFIGIGYRFISVRQRLVLRLGYSSNVTYNLDEVIRITGFRKRLLLFGILIREIKSISSLFQKLRPVNVYKGKGLILKDKKIRIKIGKQK